MTRPKGRFELICPSCGRQNAIVYYVGRDSLRVITSENVATREITHRSSEGERIKLEARKYVLDGINNGFVWTDDLQNYVANADKEWKWKAGIVGFVLASMVKDGVIFKEAAYRPNGRLGSKFRIKEIPEDSNRELERKHE